jgi:hypothetical protein
MTTALDNQRRATRASTNHLAGIEWRGRIGNARVLDLSMTGVRIATHEPLAVGDTVIVTTVRMGTRPGRVVRADHGEFGIHFTDELARGVEERWVPATR